MRSTFRDLRLRGLHVVLAELRDNEGRHGFELGLSGQTDLDRTRRHEVLDAGSARLVSSRNDARGVHPL